MAAGVSDTETGTGIASFMVEKAMNSSTNKRFQDVLNANTDVLSLLNQFSLSIKKHWENPSDCDKGAMQALIFLIRRLFDDTLHSQELRRNFIAINAPSKMQVITGVLSLLHSYMIDQLYKRSLINILDIVTKCLEGIIAEGHEITEQHVHTIFTSIRQSIDSGAEMRCPKVSANIIDVLLEDILNATQVNTTQVNTTQDFPFAMIAVPVFFSYPHPLMNLWMQNMQLQQQQFQGVLEQSSTLQLEIVALLSFVLQYNLRDNNIAGTLQFCMQNFPIFSEQAFQTLGLILTQIQQRSQQQQTVYSNTP